MGSIGWDGYPESDVAEVLDADTALEWRTKVAKLLAERKDATLPKDGWPWPWDDSVTTDFAYTYNPLPTIKPYQVLISRFGSKWMTVDQYTEWHEREDPPALPKGEIFPNMNAIKNVQFGGPQSGLIVMGVHGRAVPTTKRRKK